MPVYGPGFYGPQPPAIPIAPLHRPRTRTSGCPANGSWRRRARRR